MKFGFLTVLCLCLLFFTACEEKYETKVIGGDESSVGEISGSDSFEVFADYGKSYDVFVNSRVVAAYKSGDTSELSQLELDIYNAAKEVFDEIKKTCTTDYEIELAVHDYIVGSSTYDKQAISAISKPMENSENPYGILVNKTGICLGYTTTFQLFMDMAEIPCLTIYSEDDDGEEHAWNQVKIDGKWYYVDCTWDDPVPEGEGRPPFHTYFNVTEEFMHDSGHRWDTGDCNTADSYDAGYLVKEGVTVANDNDIKEAVKQAVKDGKSDVALKADEVFEFKDLYTGGGKIAYFESEVDYGGERYALYVMY